MSVFFNGQLLTTPTTASAVNDDAMLNQNLSVTNVVAYIGQADGGESFKLLKFSTPNAAKQALVGGELCDAVVKAFSPSSQTGSPQTVIAIRVNKAFQATLDLPIIAGTTNATGAFGTLKGKAYSKTDLGIKAKIEQGSKAGLYTVTVAGGTGASAWSVTGNDINAPGVHLKIKEKDCHILVAPGVFEIVTDEQGGDGVFQKIELDLTQYKTLGDIADYVNSVTANASGVKPFEMTFLSTGYRSLSPSVLDQKAYKTDTATPTLDADFYWNGYSFQKWFKDAVGNWLDFELNAANAIAIWHGPQIQDYKYLTSQPVVAPLPADWSNALDLLAKERNVQWVAACSGDEAVHGFVKAHVEFNSNRYKERRAIVGTPISTSNEEAIRRAKVLNSDRVSLVHIGHYAYDDTGVLTLRPAYMTAALVAAAFGGVNPGTPLTNKVISVNGLERDLDNPTETDELILGGVMPIENTDTGYKITQSISTWLVDSKFNKREQSCGVAIDFTQRNVRQAVDQLRGSKQSPILLSQALSTVKGQLTELAKPEPMGPAVLAGDENSPAFRNITGTVEGDVMRIQYEASPVVPNNYILVTMYARPYSGTATV